MARQKHKKTALISSLMIIVIVLLPLKASAFFVSPFGGKVEKYDPAPADCISNITTPILTATTALGVPTLVTVEQVDIGKPSKAKVGILRVNLFTIPVLTTIHQNFSYFIPETNVLGTYFNICDVCKKVGDATKKTGMSESAENFCKGIPVIGEFIDTLCSAAGSCPITSLVFKMGTSMPPIAEKAEKAVTDTVKKSVCTALGSIPIIGWIVKQFC